MRWVIAWGVVGSLVLLVASIVYQVMPPGTGWDAVAVVRAVRASPGSHGWSFAVSFVATAMLTSAWLLLGLLVRRGTATAADVRRAAVAWGAPLLVAPPLFSGDGWSYAADSYLTGHGRSPYVATPSVLHGQILAAVARWWRHTPAPYGPVPMIWGGLFARATGSAWLLMLASRLLALVAIGLIAYAVPELCALTGADPVRGAWLAVAAPFLLIHGVGGLHYDVVAGALMMAAVLAAARRGWLAGAVLVGVATAVKLPGLLAALGVVLVVLPAGAPVLRRLWCGVEVGLVALGTTVLIGVVGGLGVGWVHALSVPWDLRSPFSVTTDIGRVLPSLWHAHWHHWPGGSAMAVAHETGILIAVAVAVWSLLQARTGDAAAAALAVATTAAVLAALGPVVHYWYFLWGFPLLMVVPLGVRPSRVVVTVSVILALVSPIDVVEHARRWAMLVLVLLAVGTAVALLWPTGRRGATPPGRPLASATP